MAKGFNIKFQNLDKALSNIDAISVKAVSDLKEELNAFGLSMVADAKRLAPVDEGHLRNSISYELKGLTVEVIVNVNYAAYVEFGTRRFAASYVSSLPSDWQSFASQFKGKGGGSVEELLVRITEWVKRKGIGGQQTPSGRTSKSKSSIDQQENAAYIIALRILQNGVRQHPFLYPAFEKNRIELVRNLKKIFNVK